MSRRRKKDEVVTSSGVTGTATREGEEPIAPKSSGGGSVMRGELLTEGQFVMQPPVTYIDSPFGQRYLSRKTRAMSLDDIVFRLQQWVFDVRGFHGYGTVTLDISDTLGAQQLFTDWYPLVRDMAKRSLKYKHIPTTLATVPELLIHWMNAYFVVVANLTTLGNLNRLPMYNAAFASLTQFLPQAYSRMSRLWRRTSALSAPPLLKAHAIRSGSIVEIPGRTAPVIRFWNSDVLLATASGGPTRVDNLGPRALLVSAAQLLVFITHLETIERWLEIGHASVAVADFVGMKDLIDMTHDIVPGTWETGLPDYSKLPGVTSDVSIYNDIYARELAWKDDVATDQWALFPIPEEPSWGGRVPVASFGPPDPLYAYTFLGNAKYGHLNSLTSRNANVDTIFRHLGTDMILPATAMMSQIATQYDPRGTFGGFAAATEPDEQLYRDGSTTVIPVYKALDWNLASDIRTLLEGDGYWSKHIWHGVMPAVRDAFPANVWSRFLDEAGFDHIHFAEVRDFGQNYATLWAQALGIPYIR